jgi:hypothetical protein
MANSTSKTIRIIAIQTDGTVSRPLSMYLAGGHDMPSKSELLVLRLDDRITGKGIEATGISNTNIGISGSHRKEWLAEHLTGFRRKQDGVTYIMAKILLADIPTPDADSEAF